MSGDERLRWRLLQAPRPRHRTLDVLRVRCPMNTPRPPWVTTLVMSATLILAYFVGQALASEPMALRLVLAAVLTAVMGAYFLTSELAPRGVRR